MLGELLMQESMRLAALVNQITLTQIISYSSKLVFPFFVLLTIIYALFKDVRLSFFLTFLLLPIGVIVKLCVG